MTKPRSNTGRNLNDIWNVGARLPLYRKDGTWYHIPRYFPAALFDENGYLFIPTEEDFEILRTKYFSGKGDEISYSKGISSIPGYVKKSDAI